MRNFKTKIHGARNFIAGMLTMALIFALVTSVSALVAKKTATVTYNDIKVNIDGELVTLKDTLGGTVEPILVFDTLYAPVSPLARAFGYTSTYDGVSKTVFIRESKTGATTNKPLIEMPLYTMPYIEIGNATLNFNASGNDRENKISFRSKDLDNYVEYSLNGLATNFKTTISADTGVVRIYGDSELLYTSPQLTNKSPSIPVDLDVSGIKVLRLELERITGMWATVEFSNAVILTTDY